MVSKFIKVTVILLVFITGIWYFFIKDYNYKVTFKTDKAPGIVYNHVLNWNNDESFNKVVVQTLNKTPFTKIQQQLGLGDTILKIDWEFERYDTKTTLVTAKIKDENHSFIQNIEVLYSKNNFVKRSIKAVQSVKNVVIEDSEKFKVSPVEEAEIPASHCVCSSIGSTIHEKALQMINYSDLPLTYIRNNHLKIIGHPFLEVTFWNFKEDFIKFDFCFPIERENNYPDFNDIMIRDIPSKRALKVKFNGNFSISDRAWFTIIDYANSNNIALNFNPIEIFKNDPHDGGNELTWEADVYLPIVP